VLERAIRQAILTLNDKGNSRRSIARALGISRTSVKEVLESGEVDVPTLERRELFEEHLPRIRELHERCAHNLVRVHEELAAEGVEGSYQALTAFCRRHGVGESPKVAAGRYDFMPGEEMQHDTSPHRVVIGGQAVTRTCASLTHCFSRMIYAQVYPRWTRLECRHFLSEAICALGGAAARCMLDNASVIVVFGTGKHAVMSETMIALAERFGFCFKAHALGDANRSARVERPFDYIERNFYPGRTFESDEDCNRQLREWCERVSRKPKRELPGLPCELWLAEKPALRPLPLYVPEVYDVHSRRVDSEGYCNLDRNRYSVPEALIGRQLVLRESLRAIAIYDGHRLICEHPRELPGAGARRTLPEHRSADRWNRKRQPRSPSEEERRLRALDPAVADLCALLKKRSRGGAQRAFCRLHRIYVDYPTDAVVAAARQAVRYGLSDLGRIETMVLRAIAGDFFRLPVQGDDFPPICTPKDEAENKDQGEDDVYDPKDRQEDAPEPGPAGPGGDGADIDAADDDIDATDADDRHDLTIDEQGDDGDDLERGGDEHDLADLRDRGCEDDDLDLEIVIEDDELVPELEGDDGDDDDTARG
jgi:transposase